ncbi:MAG: Phosphate acyltransferase [Phycisphaerae bacterium]|nr:Phosphate acyltransferase [Phycisphaerae bacterium]
MRIALDAMGGDYAPDVVVEGSLAALEQFADLHVVLVGDEERISALLQKQKYDASRLEVVHTTQVIGMDEPPVDALRQKKDSSIMRCAQMGAAREVDAVISAGNTGAWAAACQLRLRNMSGVARAGIAVTIPAFNGPFVLIDVGANIQPKGHHLYQYAIMGSLYAQKVQKMPRQRVGLLSIGEENVKGTDTIKQANELIRNDPHLEFIGNIEGRDLFEGVCDVAVSDGFVGNIILKLFEGLSRGIFGTVAKEIAQADPAIKPAFDRVVAGVWKRHDYTEYGGAPLLGLNGVALVCHGSSDARAIRNALRTAREQVLDNLNAVMADRLAATAETSPA